MKKPAFISLDQYVADLLRKMAPNTPITGEVSSCYKCRRPSGEIEVLRTFDFADKSFTDTAVYDTHQEMWKEETPEELRKLFEYELKSKNPAIKIDSELTPSGATFKIYL